MQEGPKRPGCVKIYRILWLLIGILHISHGLGSSIYFVVSSLNSPFFLLPSAIDLVTWRSSLHLHLWQLQWCQNWWKNADANIRTGAANIRTSVVGANARPLEQSYPHNDNTKRKNLIIFKRSLFSHARCITSPMPTKIKFLFSFTNLDVAKQNLRGQTLSFKILIHILYNRRRQFRVIGATSQWGKHGGLGNIQRMNNKMLPWCFEVPYCEGASNLLPTASTTTAYKCGIMSLPWYNIIIQQQWIFTQSF